MNHYRHNDRERDKQREKQTGRQRERESLGEEVGGLSWTADCSLNVIQAGSRNTTAFPHHTGGEEKWRRGKMRRTRREKRYRDGTREERIRREDERNERGKR